MSDIILHHYPQSPVAEKVRVVLGIKQLNWYSVEIPRLPPKPDLMPLTGGYRRTPVMQIGADIYCDSQCIIREIQRRFPEPTLYPGGGAGLPWALSRWTDGPVFKLAINVVLGAAEELPEAFAADRGRLYFGPDFKIEQLQQSINQALAELRAHLGWIEQRLSSGRQFILGNEPGLPDALCYYLIWFIRGRYAGGPEFLSQFKNLVNWEERVKAIGHGQSEPITAGKALEIARNAESITPEKPDPGDPQQLKPGMQVDIVPAEDGGDPIVTGTIVSLEAETISIQRSDEQVGDVVVHFPRVGYSVTPVG